MQKIQLRILGLTTSQTQTGAYALLMTEVNGNRRLPIIIGAIEAQAIVIFLEQMNPPRPLTHDLFYQSLERFEVKLEEVLIYRLEDGIYYSKIVYRRDQQVEEVESRTSDAIALALRFSSPIYIDQEIMNRASIEFDLKEPPEMVVESASTPAPQETSQDVASENLSNVSIQELEQRLNDAVENERYEEASHLSEEIKKRKNKKD